MRRRAGGDAASRSGLLNPWLRNIRDVYRTHLDELTSIRDEPARYRRLVELNVEEQCVNVIKTAAFQRSFLLRRAAGAWLRRRCSDRPAQEPQPELRRKLAHIRSVYDLGTNRD